MTILINEGEANNKSQGGGDNNGSPTEVTLHDPGDLKELKELRDNNSGEDVLQNWGLRK